MDHQGEDCIAVGSTGTLLSLMGKEMEILQARRSCSVSYNNMNYKKSPSSKDPNTLYASDVFGFPASPLRNLPSTRLVSSLWSDLKGLLRSPTSIHHRPLIYHNNALFYKELEIHEDSDASTFYNKSPPQASPLRTHSHSSPKRTYPKQEVAKLQATLAQIITSPPSKEMYPKEGSTAVSNSCPSLKFSEETCPKEQVATESILCSKQESSLGDGCLKKKADYPHAKCALPNYRKERLAAGAAGYPNRKSPLHYHSQERYSAIAYSNRKDTGVYQVGITEIHDQAQTRIKGNRPKERSLAGAAAASPSLQYAKDKAMDSAIPTLQYPAYPKAKAMDAVYAMRRRLGSTTNDADSQNGKLLQEEGKGSARTSTNACGMKREERGICSRQDEYCMQKKEERGSLQKEYKKREERECMHDEYWTCRERREDGGSCMREYECCMQKPMLEDMEKGPCTPASSPVNRSPCFKPSRSFGGRSLAPVSVVDLQCCHTATSRERSSGRLSFTRLSSF